MNDRLRRKVKRILEEFIEINSYTAPALDSLRPQEEVLLAEAKEVVEELEAITTLEDKAAIVVSGDVHTLNQTF